MFLVLRVTRHVNVSLLGVEREVEISFHEGMIGACAVFDSLDKAEEFAEGKYKIVPLEMVRL